MRVLKFGGTSVGSPENILKVVDIVKSGKKGMIVVVSAMSGVTNQLEELGKKALKGDFQSLFFLLKEKHLNAAESLLGKLSMDQSMYLEKSFDHLHKICSGVAMLKELSDRTRAMILSTGEACSSYIISETFKKHRIKNQRLDSSQLISTDSNYLQAGVDFKRTNRHIRATIDKDQIYVAPGFIASDSEGDITTLGRGGSDYTAAIYAGAVNADVLEIWSDVDGMMSANPKLVRQANTIDQLSYNEALELSHFGAKVLYPFAIHPVLSKNIPLKLKNTFHPEREGTLVQVQPQADRTSDIAGISSINKITLVTVSGVGMTGRYGYSARIFGAMESASVNVVLITQSCSENNICFGVDQKDKGKAVAALEAEFELERMKGTIDPIEVDENLSIVAVVGDNMKYQPGVSGSTFSVLGENGVNIRAIAQGASERNISIVVDEENERKAINVLHEKFFSRAPKTVHLFVVGTGNVGEQFLKILSQQKDQLLEKYNLTLRLSGLTNSRAMKIAPNGLSKKDVKDLINGKGEKAELKKFVTAIKDLNRRNSVMVDNTATKKVCELYDEVLEKSISVVACNKIAISSSVQQYLTLRSHAEKRNVEFRFETTVGASLPIINTIEDLIHSGDKIVSIDAVLSGSLNFIFNHYNASNTFSEVVKRAMDEGYTEPDPRIDLSGIDVMRKVLILARVSGYNLEETGVDRESLFDEKSQEGKSVDQFIKWLAANEAIFRGLYQKADKKNARLKYVASFNGVSGKVGLQMINPEHPFYNLEGKDSIVMIHTERYKDEPLVVKGAGAGAELTAAGVFSDVLRIFNR